MPPDTCCTCASLLSAVPQMSASSEKPLPDKRHLDCCGRIICGACTSTNPRFLRYCPFCQTSGRCPPQGDRPLERARSAKEEEESRVEAETDNPPPPYSASPPSSPAPCPPSPTLSPPPYTVSPSSSPPSPPRLAEREALAKEPHSRPQTKTTTSPKANAPPTPPPLSTSTAQAPPPGYILHHLRHPPHPSPDTLASLSLAYGIPSSILRAHNHIPPDADYLLAARHTLLIPTAYITTSKTPSTTTATTTTTTGQTISSLSPDPVEDPTSRARKTALRRFMVACREPDYDAARVYLEESGWNLDAAVGRYLEDVAWEKEHPCPDPSPNSGRQRRGAGRFGWFKGLVGG
ncbi:hypothetical protein VTJ49DRAFT_3656 [Mycothermus thermophilus]|uniref:LysM domain-containing protein n=1 Tax=Humicola insolens TaxID=85995 RepID=A0ABR3V6Z6_HUMIN